MSFLDLRFVQNYTTKLSKVDKEGRDDKFVDYNKAKDQFRPKSNDKKFRELSDKPKEISEGEFFSSERSLKIMEIAGYLSKDIADSAKGSFVHRMQNSEEKLDDKQMRRTAHAGAKLAEEIRSGVLNFLFPGGHHQTSGHQPITCDQAHRAINYANTRLNDRYGELREKILSEENSEEEPETKRALPQATSTTTTTTSSLNPKQISNVAIKGNEVSTKEREKKLRPKNLTSCKAATATTLPKHSKGPETEQKEKRSKSERDLYEAGLTHRNEPKETKKKLLLDDQPPLPRNRDSDEDDSPRPHKNEHTPDGKVKWERDNRNLSEAEDDEFLYSSRTRHEHSRVPSETSEDDKGSRPEERVDAARVRARKKFEDEQSTPTSDKKRKRDSDDAPPSGSEGYLY